MKRAFFFLAALTAMLILAAGCSASGPASGLSDGDDFQKWERSHFGFFRSQSSLPFVKELRVHWDRPHPGPFIWGEIEKEQGGEYDFSGADAVVREDQKYGVLTVATIWPYANWDQVRCHARLPDERRLFSILGDYRGKPCDPDTYRRFVEALVERYDGDGKDDMPGLVYPIKYWEVSNEPDVAEGALFFKGDPQSGDYLELLAETHEAIRRADPDAKVMNGGIAFLTEKEKPFWREVLGNEVARYVDIVTLHSITQGEDLQMPALSDLMEELVLERPVWITEIQFAKSRAFLESRGIPPEPEAPGGTGGPQNLSEEEWSSVLIKSFSEAFARGADKLFYVGLDNTTPTEESSLLVSCQLAEGAVRGDPFDPAFCRRQKPFYAFKTMVEMIDYFDSAEKLGEGRFRFSVGGRHVYVLWGAGPLPAEITGDAAVAVTDIQGARRETPAGALVLTDVPVFVEREI